MGLPGTRLLAIARLWFDERSVRDVFEPLVADWQAEYASAPASAQRRIWLRGAIALAATTVGVAERSVRREILRPPSVALTGALIGSALLACSATYLLLNVLQAAPRPTPDKLAVVALVVWAGAIWPPNRPARERPLATYLRLSAILLLIVGVVSGPHAIVLLLPLVPVCASFKLPLRSPGSELRRTGLVFGPIAVLAVVNPVVELGSWPRFWRDAMHLSWGVWGVVVCSFDATRTAGNPERLPPQNNPRLDRQRPSHPRGARLPPRTK